MKRIRTKLFLGFIAMAALTVSILWLIQAGVMRDSYVNERIGSVRDALNQAVLEQRQDYETLAEQLNASLIVIHKNGDVLYRTQGLPMMGMMQRAAQNMLPGGMDNQPRFVGDPSGQGRYALLGQPMNEERFLIAVFSLADVDEAARILRRQLWIVTLILFVASIVLASVLSRKMSKPIRAVTRAARELAKGRLDIALPVKSQDEIGHLTQALNELSQELKKTDQLRKELIANVSHELRAPLTVIRGYAETVRDVTWPDDEKRRQQLTLIADEAQRLTRVVRDILDYSRLQAGVEKLNLAPVSLCPLIHQVTSRYEQVGAASGIDFQTRCLDVTIQFDENRLAQVFHNLLSNAINHANPETTIEIEVIQEPDLCRIEIKNKGETIPPESINRIWDRYHRSEQLGSRQLGTGLGLAIVKTILEQHGVPFGVHSQDGETIFWFCAPYFKK
jgi:signal transduction histidine kinase